jgi:hypothetical protein
VAGASSGVGEPPATARDRREAGSGEPVGGAPGDNGGVRDPGPLVDGDHRDVYGHVAPDVSREAVATLGAVSDSLNYPYASKRRSSVAPGVQAR